MQSQPINKSTKKIIWRLYFWIFVASMFLTYLFHEYWRVWESADAFVSSIAAIGLYSYAWGKTHGAKAFWKVFLLFLIAWNMYFHYVLPLPESVQETYEISQIALATPTVLFMVPLFIALYFYAFRVECKKVVHDTKMTPTE